MSNNQNCFGWTKAAHCLALWVLVLTSFKVFVCASSLKAMNPHKFPEIVRVLAKGGMVAEWAMDASASNPYFAFLERETLGVCLLTLVCFALAVRIHFVSFRFSLSFLKRSEAPGDF